MKIYEGMENPNETPVAFTKDGVVLGYFWNLLALAFGDGGLFPTKDAAYQEQIRQLRAEVSTLRSELAEARKPQEKTEMSFLKRLHRVCFSDPMY